ncbi:DUF3558 family protein, partial [Amycolatopsis sp. H20-H5]|uniref:DUF3558 family protein n=1 Tax=Amycolatopsis sp. H20-H5 TaxID=3046309 RepID=UPI002DBDC9C3
RGGCATPVPGTAGPVPGQGPVLPGGADPCALISEQQAAALKLAFPPKLRPASKTEGLHSYCTWEPAEQAYSLVHLTATWSLDQSIGEFNGGALARDTVRLGGLSWTTYPGIGGDNACSLVTVLGPTSFLGLDSLVLGEGQGPAGSADPCAYPKAVAPAIAAHLPGGSPAPPGLTPPTRPAPASGPLVGLDPCTMLTAEQATGLGLVGTGMARNPPAGDPISGCQWADTDGPGGQNGFVVWLGPAKPAAEWYEVEGQPVESGGRTWSLVPNLGNNRRTCAATLVVTPASSLSISSGYENDLDRMCDLVQAAMPLVGGHLPP